MFAITMDVNLMLYYVCIDNRAFFFFFFSVQFYIENKEMLKGQRVLVVVIFKEYHK